MLNVEIVFIGQYFIILLPRVVTFGSDSTGTFRGLSSRSILVVFLGLGGQVDAVRLDPVLATLIIGVQSWWDIRSCHRESDTVLILCHAVMGNNHAEAHRSVVLDHSGLNLCLDVFLFLPHEARSRLLALLHVPLLLYGFRDLLFMHFLHDVVAGLLVSRDNLWSDIHLQLFLGNVVDRIPELSVRFLSLVRIFEVQGAFQDELLEKFWVLE